MLFSMMPIEKMCLRAVDILIDNIESKEKLEVEEEVFQNAII
jgi:hypothetical protein